MGSLVAHVPLLGTQQRVIVEPSDDSRSVWGTALSWRWSTGAPKKQRPSADFPIIWGTSPIPPAIFMPRLKNLSCGPIFRAAPSKRQSLGKQVSQKDIKEREDLRDLISLTIDPDTAKDFDDAISLTKDPQGIYHLGVHIADVSHYVRPGTALDDEAQLRCNSTYFPNYCLPMLPGELSENLCSLKPDVNRLTVSVLMRFDPHGTLLDFRIARTVIKSAKRFTYREAKKVLDGQKKSPHSTPWI